MDENMKKVAEQLKKNPALVKSLMQSRDGQMLMQMLTGKDQGASLQRAAQAAANGDPAEIMKMMNQVLKSPGGSELVERINKAVRK